MFSNSLSPRRRTLAISIAVAPLLLAACGGSSSGPAGGATAASWCDFADESDVVDEIFESLASSPSDLEDGITRVESFVKRLPDEAPDEIKDDAQRLAEGTQMLVDAIKAADFDLFDADLSFMEDATLESELDDASANIDEYTQRECGRSFSGDDDSADSGDLTDDSDASADEGDDDPSDFNPADGTIREQLVAQIESIGLSNDEATCIADKLDFNDPAVQSGDIGAMLDLFDECGIGLDRLAELGG